MRNLLKGLEINADKDNVVTAFAKGGLSALVYAGPALGAILLIGKMLPSQKELEERFNKEVAEAEEA